MHRNARTVLNSSNNFPMVVPRERPGPNPVLGDASLQRSPYHGIVFDEKYSHLRVRVVAMVSRQVNGTLR